VSNQSMTDDEAAPQADTAAESASQTNTAEPSRESLDSLRGQAADPGLREDAALSLLKRSDLPGEVLEQIAKHGALAKSRKVRLALVTHPMTPRPVSLPIVRHLYTFDLMRVALTPVVPADVKVAADEALLGRMEKIALGEKLSLAKRASGRVAGVLLNDPDLRVIDAALENPHLTETAVVKSLTRREATENLVREVCRHPKWSLRQDIRIALLQNGKTPLSKALEFARSMRLEQAREILESSQLSEEARFSLVEQLGGAARD
jgi:hypothetical protein